MNNYENINKDERNDKKAFNYGLALLKCYLVFLVEIIHNFNRNSTNNKIILKIAAGLIHPVPPFFIISFYFMSDNLLSANLKIFLKRLKRLLIPYIIWPIIVLFFDSMINIKYNGKFEFSFEILILQILFGHKYMTQFWFQWNLIITTILFKSIIAIFREKTFFIFYLVFLFSYLSQYSGYINKIIFQMFPDYNRYTFARLFGMLPLGVTGFTLGFYKIIDYLKKHTIQSLFFSYLIYYFIINYKVFVNLPIDNYYGISLNIKACCIIFIFSLFPSQIIKNKYIKRFLAAITNYSAGVYYLHISIHKFFSDFFNDIKNGTFLGIIINYLICYFICFFGILIFGKTSIKYLFC